MKYFNSFLLSKRGTVCYSVLMIILFTGLVHAQKPVKVDLIPLFEQVSAPPLLCKDAFDKGFCNTENGSVQCNVNKLFVPLKTKLDSITKEINSIIVTGPSGDQLKIADEIKKKGGAEKIKKMSKEEKMKLAMDMMKDMGMTKTYTETDEVKDAFAKESELNQFISTQIQDQMSNYKTKEKQDKEAADKHIAIDEWMKTEISKLPRISSGEMAEPDPKEIKRVKLEAAEKHIKLADEELKNLTVKWVEIKALYKQKSAPYCESLAKCNYGENVQNQGWVNVFAQGQGLVITMISEIIKRSEDAYNFGAKYYAEKVVIEKGN
jgi:hypothetical protein